MTTTKTFFEKVFNEGDKIAPHYKNYDFSAIPDYERRFLSKLAYVSRYKSALKNFLLKDSLRTHDKENFIVLYGKTLTYQEDCALKIARSELKVARDEANYVFAAGSTYLTSGNVILWVDPLY